MSIEMTEITAEEALEFRHFSVHNAVQAQLACPEGTCEAYQDIFTRRRWRAQGYRIRKGEDGAVIQTWIEVARNGKGSGRQPRRAFLFCRHQVERDG